MNQITANVCEHQRKWKHPVIDRRASQVLTLKLQRRLSQKRKTAYLFLHKTLASFSCAVNNAIIQGVPKLEGKSKRVNFWCHKILESQLPFHNPGGSNFRRALFESQQPLHSHSSVLFNTLEGREWKLVLSHYRVTRRTSIYQPRVEGNVLREFLSLSRLE